MSAEAEVVGRKMGRGEEQRGGERRWEKKLKGGRGGVMGVEVEGNERV